MIADAKRPSSQGHEIGNDGLAFGAGVFMEFIGTLIAPVGLAAIDGDFLHVAKVGAGFADEFTGLKAGTLRIETTKRGNAQVAGGAELRRSHRTNGSARDSGHRAGTCEYRWTNSLDCVTCWAIKAMPIAPMMPL